MHAEVLDDRYELGDELGRGGAAIVRRARDRVRGREVAVKLTDVVVDARGRGEAAMLEALDHPNVVALYDVLDLGEGTALVMELVDGPSLHDRLQDGTLDPAEAAVVLRDVGDALAHAHRRGVVHRDVKPGNVLLRLEAGRVVGAVLSDFGIARLADATRTTREGAVVGTLRYLSPEQVRGERATSASDVYSLGLTVLAALTGGDAFPGGETESLAARLLRPPPLPDGLAPDWIELLTGMTDPDPANRFDASSAAALGAVVGSETVPVRSALPPPAEPALVPPVRRRGLAGAAAAVAVLGAAAGAMVAAFTLGPHPLSDAAGSPTAAIGREVPASSAAAGSATATSAPAAPVPVTAVPAPAARTSGEQEDRVRGGSLVAGARAAEDGADDSRRGHDGTSHRGSDDASGRGSGGGSGRDG